MKVSIDTNVLAYAEGVNGAPMRRTTLAILENLNSGTAVIPVQALGELFAVLVRKARRSPRAAREAILTWHDAFPTIETSAATMTAAIDLAAEHKLGIWDSVMLAASASAGCRLFLSEDLQDGFTWGGVTVTNPYRRTRHPLLVALLEGR